MNLLNKDRRLTPAQLIKAGEEKFPGFKCGLSTMRRYLFKKGYIGRVCVEKPLLRPSNKVRRLEWAKTHQAGKKEQWHRVLWSDGKKFELYNSKRRLYCKLVNLCVLTLFSPLSSMAVAL